MSEQQGLVEFVQAQVQDGQELATILESLQNRGTDLESTCRVFRELRYDVSVNEHNGDPMLCVVDPPSRYMHENEVALSEGRITQKEYRQRQSAIRTQGIAVVSWPSGDNG